MESWQSLRAEISEALKTIKDLPSDARAEVGDELRVLRRLVLNQRDPRVAIVGKTDVSLHEIMSSFGTPSAWDDVRERLGQGRWYEHEFEEGILHIADLRGDVAEPCLRALEYLEPDVVLAVARSEDEDVEGVARTLIDAMELTDDTWGSYPAGLAAIYRDTEGRNAGDFRTMQAFKDRFVALDRPRDFVEVVSAARPPALARSLMREMPLEARFVLATMTDDIDTKRELAFELTRVASTLNAAIASVPIPVASAFPITSIQIAMVAGIAKLSGRQLNLSAFAEFGVAIGLNVGAAVVFRELARALVLWIPVAGSVISASIAAGATLTLGKAATRYYLG